MTDELMVSAVCWELDAAVSASFAHTVKVTENLLFFCPECLVDVAASISTRKNFFFKAPKLHRPGCKHEKRQTDSNLPARDLVDRHSPQPDPIIPSHLGALPKHRKKSKPSMSERQALAERLQPSVVLHPGTLREVVDAWSTMSMGDRKTRPLTVGNTQLTYFDAFDLLNRAGGDISALGCAGAVVFGPASVNLYGGSFYVTSWSKFNIGGKALAIKARVRPGDPDFDLLEDGQKGVVIFLHGATPTPNPQVSYLLPPTVTPHTGFVIKKAE
ncbi:hypothetical protein [Pseudomonas sp. LjRoot263]|jgi:hypothetical protein|uniref:hypothetical protein n=1 Tax=Pseudomonas sp. LjRoot263 TaxID=3342302 RepID=UPI003ED03986